MKNAFILIDCEENQEEDIIVKLQKIKNVEYVQKTIGIYNIIVKIRGKNTDKLKQVIKNKIKEIQNIHHTLTLTELI